MKNVNKLLLLFAIFALTGSMASVMAQIPTSILGEYVGELHVSSDNPLIPDQTFYDVKMEVKENNPYSITVAAMDIGGVPLPEYELNEVIITQSGNGYKLTRNGVLNIVIDEIEIPGIGKLYDVPVKITLKNGYIENDVLTLDLEAVATVVIIIFPIDITINIGFEGTLPPPPACDPVTNVNAQIENCEKATITWNAVTGAKEYEVTRDGVAPVIVSTSPYIEDFEFEHGNSYTWKIKTICDQNESSEVSVSATADCEMCNPVTNPEAQIEDCEKATITWNPVAGAKEYKIVREGVDPVIVTVPSYIEDFEFEHGNSYTWKIKTICDQNESSEVSVSATADCEMCNPVTGVSAGEPSCEGATITWNVVAGAKEYKISRDGVTTTVIEPTYTDPDTFWAGVTYTWVIVTVCDENESEPVEITEMGNCMQGINELTNSISVYPNPTDGQLQITNYELRIENIEIFDVMGRCVATVETHGRASLQLDISHLPSGVYFVRIQTENGAVITRKVIKQ
jgi:hypothetical protein